MSLWQLGNEVTSAAQDVYQRYTELAASGTDPQATRQARFVQDNAPVPLFYGWVISLDGLLQQTLEMVHKVGAGSRSIKLGCVAAGRVDCVAGWLPDIASVQSTRLDGPSLPACRWMCCCCSCWWRRAAC